MSTLKARMKAAELLATMGVLVLGLGLGAWLAAPLAGYIIPLLMLGGVCHALGMFAKHRFETSAWASQPGWYRALYWSCWTLMVVLAVLLFLRPA